MAKTAVSEEKEKHGDLRQEIQDLVEANNLNMCLECGKCSAVCPMVAFYGEYVYNRCARSVVERLTLSDDGFDDEALWYCLACQECTFFCPSGVDFQSFMSGLRERLIAHGYKEYAHFCKTCGSYLMPKRQRDNLETAFNGNGTRELLYECPVCKKNRHADILFKLAPKRRFFR